MIYYELVKVTINIFTLAKIIINIVVEHYSFPDLIVINQDLHYNSNFWLSLYYYLGIKRKLSTSFYPQTNNQTKRQNSTIEVYLHVFVNYEQNN